MVHLRRLRGANNEGPLALLLVLLVVVMSVVNPVFYDPSTLLSIVRGATVPLVLALAVLIVLVAGGIDVSFAAVAIFAAYTAMSITLLHAPGLPAVAVIGLAVLIGAVLGLVNGAVIARFGLPTLIVTLGTQGLFTGAMYTFVGATYFAQLPESLIGLSSANVLDTTTSAGRAALHVVTFAVVVLAVLVWLMLTRTMFGRSLYAIGGDAEAARRAGFRVRRTQVLVFVLVGVLAALAGVAHMVLGRSVNPQDLLGGELDVIAAVVLGGASIFGGRGSVLGTVLGVLIIQVINNSLLLAGVPSAWLRAAVGILLVLGVGAQALAARREARGKTAVDDETDRQLAGAGVEA